jgi:cell division protein FtsQ
MYSTKFEFINKLLIENGFFIKNVDIKGINHLNQKDILKIINSYNKKNIFNVDLKKIYNEITQNTWVEELSIKKIYPNTLKIDLIEKEPIAIWQNKSVYHLITKNGEIILEANLNNFKKQLPIIIGKNAHKNVYSILQILNIDKNLTKNIWSLTFVNERRWDIHFNQGLTIRLPSTSVKEAWEKIILLSKKFNILSLDLTELDLRSSKNVLGKINIDKKLIFKKKKL